MNKNDLSTLQCWILIHAQKGGGTLEKAQIQEKYFKFEEHNGRFNFFIRYSIQQLRAKGLVEHEGGERIILSKEGRNLADNWLKERPCLLL